MIETDWYEEFEYAKEPTIVFQDDSVYINGVEVKLGKYILHDVKTVQFKVDRIMKIIFRPETVIVFVPERYDVDTAYITEHKSVVKVVFYGDRFECGVITGIMARDDGEEYKLTFNSKFPMPEELKNALNDNVQRGIFILKEGK